ncbi:apoptotic protease-activating factor 1 isoform X3, partial [Lates japonicus]
VWRWQSGEGRVLKGHKEQVRCFSLLSHSPTRLLSWSFDGTVKVWDVESGEKLQDIEAHRGAILSCHVSPDGCFFATTSADKTAKPVDLLNHQPGRQADSQRTNLPVWM